MKTIGILIPASVGQLTLELETAEARQPDVEHETSGNVGPLAAEEILRGREGLDMQAYRADQALSRLANRRIVVDHKHD